MDRGTLGVEEEFQVVDASTGALVPRADELLDAAGAALGKAVTRELNLCQVETGSPVCTDLGDLAAHIRRSRRALAEHAAAIGLGIAAVGTHPSGRWQEQRVDRGSPRFRRLEDTYQLVAREQIICGNHVHVGVADPDVRIATMTRVRPWLPVVLALSANSPFWQGHDTGYASYRTQLWQRWPTSGMPPAMATMDDYDRVVGELVDAGVVDDPSYLYWYVRPSSRYPTVEVRIGDTLLDPGDAVAIAGIVRALVWTEAQSVEAGAPAITRRSRDVLDAATWRASRFGIGGTLVSPTTGATAPAAAVVAELLAHIAGALDAHGDRAIVEASVGHILTRGTGADLQRALLRADADPRAVVVGAVHDATTPAA